MEQTNFFVSAKYSFEPLPYSEKTEKIKLEEILEPNFFPEKIYSKNLAIKNIDDHTYYDSYMCELLTHSGPTILLRIHTKKQTIKFLENVSDIDSVDKKFSVLTKQIKKITPEIVFYYDYDHKICSYMIKNNMFEKIGIWTYSQEYSNILSYSIDKMSDGYSDIISESTSEKFKNIIVIAESNYRISKTLNYHETSNVLFVCEGISKLIKSLKMLEKHGNLVFYTLNLTLSSQKYIFHLLANFFSDTKIVSVSAHSLFSIIVFRDFGDNVNSDVINRCTNLLEETILFLQGKSKEIPIIRSVYESEYYKFLESSIEYDSKWWLNAIYNYPYVSKLQILYHIEFLLLFLRNKGYSNRSIIYFDEHKNDFTPPIMSENILYEFLYDNFEGIYSSMSSLKREHGRPFIDKNLLGKFDSTLFDQYRKTNDINRFIIDSIYDNNLNKKINYIFQEILHLFNGIHQISRVEYLGNIIYDHIITNVAATKLIFLDNTTTEQELFNTILPSNNPDTIFILKASIFSDEKNIGLISTITEKFKYVLLYRSLLNILDSDIYVCFCIRDFSEPHEYFRELFYFYFNLFCKKAFDSMNLFNEIVNIVSSKRQLQIEPIVDKIKVKWENKFDN